MIKKIIKADVHILTLNLNKRKIPTKRDLSLAHKITSRIRRGFCRNWNILLLPYFFTSFLYLCCFQYTKKTHGHQSLRYTQKRKNPVLMFYTVPDFPILGTWLRHPPLFSLAKKNGVMRGTRAKSMIQFLEDSPITMPKGIHLFNGKQVSTRMVRNIIPE